MQAITYPTVGGFVEKTREWLRKEEEYEVGLFNEMTSHKTIQQIESEGMGLSSMVVLASRKGFYGKVVITLAKSYYSDKNPQALPEECKMQVGDNVALFKNNIEVADGIIYKRASGKLKVSLRQDKDDEDDDLEGLVCNVVIKWNEVTFRRYHWALNQLANTDCHLLRYFFSNGHDTVPSTTQPLVYDCARINAEQVQAVKGGLTDTIHLLHGPPGTGKTTTVCELIKQAVRVGQKVLACAPSNIAVDNMLELLFRQVRCVRIGNPARVIEPVISCSLDYLVAKQTNLWKNEVKKLNVLKKKLAKASRDEKKALHREMKAIRAEISAMQEQTIQEILDDCDVIFCTNVGAGDRVFKRYLSKKVFDLVVIDECGQSLEISCWIPLLRGRRAYLAGDHKQLPPTIKGHANCPLAYTLFSRAMEELSSIPTTMLCTQYRMNSLIMGWSNQMFYDGRLNAHSSVAGHQLSQLYERVQAEEEVLMMIDSAGCGMGESGEENQSKFNVGEADIAIAIYRKMLGYGVEGKHIAILTPYSKQVAFLKNLLSQKSLPAVDVSTVDGIQGREKECIIISLVRSNAKREIGFLKDWRRMNVAVTRARRMLVLIGNSDCVRSDPKIGSLMDWIEQHGHVSSAQELRSNGEVRFGEGVSDQIENYAKDKKTAAESNKQTATMSMKPSRMQRQAEQQHSEQEQAELKDHYLRLFGGMLNEVTVNNATAFERKMIHEVAEQLQLAHETSADKASIRVWRKLTDEQLKAKIQQLEEERLRTMDEVKSRPNKNKKKNQNKNKNAQKGSRPNQANGYVEQMKQLVGEQSSEEDVPNEETKEVQPAEEVQAVTEPKQKKKKAKKSKPELEEEGLTLAELDDMFSELEKSRAPKDQCYSCNKKLTMVTSVTCKFCQVNFCRSHVLAEEHGCGEAAQQEARSAYSRGMDKHIEQGAEKIKQKIKEQEEQRRRKVKEEPKNK